MPVIVYADTTAAIAAMRDLGAKVASSALRRAISRAVDAASTEGSRAIREDLNVTAAAVKRAIRTRKVIDAGEIRASARPSGLINFGSRRSKSGVVSVKILRGGARERLRHAFIAAGKAGNVHVFERVRQGDRFAGRLPIRRLATSSIAERLANPEPQRRMRSVAAQRFADTLEHEIDRAVSKVRR